MVVASSGPSQFLCSHAATIRLLCTCLLSFMLFKALKIWPGLRLVHYYTHNHAFVAVMGINWSSFDPMKKLIGSNLSLL